MLRILFVLPYVPSLIRVRSYNFIKELSRSHRITVLATGSSQESAEATVLRAVCTRVEIVQLRHLTSLMNCGIAAVRGNPLQAAFCRSSELEWRLSMLLRDQHFDVVHLEHLRAGYARWGIPSMFPTVFDSVDCISLLLERTLRSSHSPYQRLIAALELARTRAYEARLASQFNRTVVTSAEDAAALQALTPQSNITVVPNGVDVDYFQPLDIQRDPMTIVLSGKMSYHANVTAVLHFTRHIFPLVRRTCPEVRLLIVGSDPPAVIRRLARDPGISITGYVPDIREAVGRATLAICPVTVKVGIQNKILEAMAMGLPVVSTKEGAKGLAAEPEEEILVADDPTEFADKVCRILADKELRDRLGRAGRRYVEQHHRWELAAQQMENLYKQAIEQQVRSRPGLSSAA